jgi:hypothetical protein
VVLENLDSETIVGYIEISSRFENSDIFIIIDIAEKKRNCFLILVTMAL